MAQLMIDTDTESVAGLMLLSRLLTDYANMRAVANRALEESYTKAVPAALQAVAEANTSKLVAEHFVSATNNEPDPAKLFGKFPVPVPTGASNVVPLFPQPVPLNLPGAASVMGLAVSTATPTLDAPTVTAPTLPTNAPSLPVESAAVLSANAPPLTTPVTIQTGVMPGTEVDSQGIPWDERIHSSSKKKKGDGTWILKRGVDHTLAQTITAQLVAAKLPVVDQPSAAIQTTGVASVAGNPLVSLPPALLSMPPPAVNMPLASLPGQQANVPANLPTSAPVTGPPPVNPVARFREMMGKISAGLAAKTITQQQVTDAHRGSGIGLEQLQQAVLFPDKIPLIEAALGFAS